MTIISPRVRVSFRWEDEDEPDKPLTAVGPGEVVSPIGNLAPAVTLMVGNPKSFACEIHGVEMEPEAGPNSVTSVALSPSPVALAQVSENNAVTVTVTFTNNEDAAGDIILLARRA